MNPKRWQKIKKIFSRAVELRGTERDEYLKIACASDNDLMKEVYSLIVFFEKKGPLDGSLDKFKISALSSREKTLKNRQIGPYRIIQELGYGGMGSVYLCERADGEFKHHVALKLLRTGFTTPEQNRRFLAERQILALLNHDHIARLYDGGLTEEGQPYFVMEYINGKPIDRYCRENSLTIEKRLELFLKVCDAMEYAHRNLVVHRDLKPANIMVSDEGKVKLLDFGIAKLLDESKNFEGPQALTQQGFLPLTPVYASPEQMRGKPITTASDIYQLGVVLYELLTGFRPYEIDNKSPGEAEQIVCEEVALRPAKAIEKFYALSKKGKDPDPKNTGTLGASDVSRFQRKLRGDLDMIVMQALRKEPDRRYASVRHLADDIERHLAGRPVSAHPDSWSYRSRKFIRRNKKGVAAIFFIFLLLAGYAFTLTWHSHRTQAVLAEAEKEKAKSEQVVEFLLGMFEANDPAEAMGATVTAHQLMQRGVQQAEKLSGQPEVQAQMFNVTGLIYRRLGEYQEAFPLLERALKINDSIFESPHPKIANGHFNLADVLHDLGNYPQAYLHYKEAAEIFQQIPGHLSLEYAESLHNLAVSRHDQPEMETIKKALKMRLELLHPNHPDIAESFLSLGQAYLIRKDFQAAEEFFEKSLSIARVQQSELSPQIAGILKNLGEGFRAIGRLDQAESLLKDALAIYEQLYQDPQTHMAINTKLLADVYSDRRDYSTAENLYKESLGILYEAVGGSHPLRRPILQSFAEMYMHKEAYEDAEPLLREVVNLLESVLQPNHPRIAKARKDLAVCLIAIKKHPMEAEKLLLQSLDVYQNLKDERYEQDEKIVLENLVNLYDFLEQENKVVMYSDLLNKVEH